MAGRHHHRAPALSRGLVRSDDGSGKNLFNNNRAGAGGYGVDSALAYQNGHLGQGWNEAFWSNLEGYFQEAQDQDIGVIVNVWGTVALEGQRDPSCPDTYEVELDPYLATLRQALDTIESWEDEPGVELTEGALPAP